MIDQILHIFGMFLFSKSVILNIMNDSDLYLSHSFHGTYEVPKPVSDNCRFPGARQTACVCCSARATPATGRAGRESANASLSAAVSWTPRCPSSRWCWWRRASRYGGMLEIATADLHILIDCWAESQMWRVMGFIGVKNMLPVAYSFIFNALVGMCRYWRDLTTVWIIFE